MTDRDRFKTAVSRVRLRLVADDRLVASIRRGDVGAFETVYERYCAGLLSFSVYMLGSRHDAEDAVQATFAAAYRTLRGDPRPVTLRPWLFAIARNQCLSTIRRRHPTVELNGEVAPTGDPLKELELREEIRSTFEGLRGLPERQRAALVLAELHGLSHAEISAVLDVHTSQVKAFIYQARSNLISERQARETDCQIIREELATARGTALLRGRLRRHVRSCADCRVYADGVASQRRQLGALALVPLAPSLMFRFRALGEALSGSADPTTYAGGVAVGGSVAGAAVEVAGGGAKALVAKIAASVACLGAGAGVGVSVLDAPVNSKQHGSTTSESSQLLADSNGGESTGWAANAPAIAEGAAGETGRGGDRRRGGSSNGSRTEPATRPSRGAGGFRSMRADPSERGGHAQGQGGHDQDGAGAGHQGSGEHSTTGATSSPERDEQRRLKHEAQQTKEAERLHKRETHQRKQEEQQAGGGSLAREEERAIRRKEREEREGVRGARPPPTEEQLQHKREKREQKLKEREREEAEHAGS